MISIDEAKEIAANAHESFADHYDTWTEFEKAFVFSVSNNDAFGGWLSPFCVDKETGDVSFSFFPALMNGDLGEELSEGNLN